MSEELNKNFDWDAYEKGETYGSESKEELT
jgi:hypothetical protein